MFTLIGKIQVGGRPPFPKQSREYFAMFRKVEVVKMYYKARHYVVAYKLSGGPLKNPVGAETVAYKVNVDGKDGQLLGASELVFVDMVGFFRGHCVLFDSGSNMCEVS